MLRWKSKLSVLLERHLQMRREEIGISLKLGRRAAERERGNWNLVKITGESVLIICFQFLTRGYLLKAQSAFPPTKTNNTNGIILSRWCSSNDRIFFKINTSGQEISKVNASKKKKKSIAFSLNDLLEYCGLTSALVHMKRLLSLALNSSAEPQRCPCLELQNEQLPLPSVLPGTSALH